jgi:queuine tRNA-ribosyltransferase
VGRITTPHGTIDTPGYVAVGTNAALKAVATAQADAEGLQLMFCNTYHLMLHPGAEVVESAGGLHAFMGRRRDRPLITDSGGFQVFSLAYGGVHEELQASLKRGASGGGPRRGGSLVARVDEAGVTFRSYRDGTAMLLSPESSVAAQKQLGADIILPLDELPPYHIGEEALAASVERSHRWEARRRARAAGAGAPPRRAPPRSAARLGRCCGGSKSNRRPCAPPLRAPNQQPAAAAVA